MSTGKIGKPSEENDWWNYTETNSAAYKGNIITVEGCEEMEQVHEVGKPLLPVRLSVK